MVIMKKYIILSLLFCFMNCVQVSCQDDDACQEQNQQKIETVCHELGVSQVAFEWIHKKIFSSSPNEIRLDFYDPEKAKSKHAFKDVFGYSRDDFYKVRNKLLTDEEFMKATYPSVENLPAFVQLIQQHSTYKDFSLENFYKSIGFQSQRDHSDSEIIVAGTKPTASTGDNEQQVQVPSLFSFPMSRANSVARSIYSGISYNAMPAILATAVGAVPNFVQKNKVGLPSQAALMFFPAVVFSRSMAIKGDFPLIDTTSIVFQREGKEKASIADNIVSTGIINAHTICATGAAVTAVAACNPKNTWQATASLAALSSLCTFSWYNIMRFKRAFNKNQEDVRREKMQVKTQWKNDCDQMVADMESNTQNLIAQKNSLLQQNSRQGHLQAYVTAFSPASLLLPSPLRESER